MSNEIKKEKFSYSKLSTFEQCPYKYKLVYTDKHFIYDASIATDFGTLLHYIEEIMARKIVTNCKLDSNDYLELKDMAENIENEEEKVYGAKILRERWKNDWYQKDKTGRTYEDKFQEYLNKGIYRLRNYLIEHPSYEIIAIEKEFNLEFGEFIFNGFIDRAYKDTITGQIIIEDIKTWKEPVDHSHLTTPLQFVIYNLACQEIFNIKDNQIACQYELILCNQKQEAGTKGYIIRGVKKLNSLLQDIKSGIITPKPSALCHWCPFCATKPDQKEEAKGLCPYYSKWTSENKTSEVRYEWMGPENHEAIMKDFQAVLELQSGKSIIIKSINENRNIAKLNENGRRFLVRR